MLHAALSLTLEMNAHVSSSQLIKKKNTLVRVVQNIAPFADICSNQISPQAEHFNTSMKSDGMKQLQDVDPEVSWVLFL